jgi:cobalt/nickel transport system ATP-binding protein
LENKIICIKNLNYSYPDGTQALCDINLEIQRGESLGIIGSNGAGKSTLLLHINGILRGRGKINVLGRDLTDKNLSLIRSMVGLVFQDPDSQLFMPTVFDDVSFGPINMGMQKQDVEKSVHKALKEVDMLASIKRSSHHLSVGEKKRIAIATVLSMNPQILVLDEPSSNLDPKHRRDLIKLLNKLEMTKIIATHDLGLIEKTCSRIILMEEGKIIAGGLCPEFLAEAADFCQS